MWMIDAKRDEYGDITLTVYEGTSTDDKQPQVYAKNNSLRTTMRDLEFFFTETELATMYVLPSLEQPDCLTLAECLECTLED